jgi:hypothetical protein
MGGDTPAATILSRELMLTDPDTGEELSRVSAIVVSVERREESGIFGDVVGLDARLDVRVGDDAQPHRYFVSRLLDEPHWVQDAHLWPNGRLDFSNGFGARYLKLHGLHPGLEALVDEAACSLGLAGEIGPDIPLALTSTGDTSG